MVTKTALRAALLALIALLLAACGGTAAPQPTTGAAPTTAPAAKPTEAPKTAATTAPAAATTAPAAKATEAPKAAAPTTAPAAQKPALSGKLQFYPQGYYNPQSRPDAAKVVEAVVADYQKLNPNVQIELVPQIGDDSQYRQFLLTRLSAGQAPNITWEQYSDRNNEKDDVWVRLDEYLDKPNPYVPAGQPGSAKWRDQFPDYVLAQTRGGNGHWYEIAMDWVETGLFYNKDVFKKVGIEPKWKNLTEFVNDCQKIRAAGIDPLGVFITPESNTYQWLDDVLFSSAFGDIGPQWYIEKYNIPGRSFRRLNPEETAKAIQDGKLKVDDPRFDVYLKLVKQVSDACLMKGFAGGLTRPDMVRLFSEGKLAMTWLVTADVPGLKDAKFDYGLTYLPPITKAENPYSVNETQSYRVGGPSGPAQYGITQATAKAGLLEEAIDFLQFWSAPQNFQKVYDSYPIQVPMVAGVKPSEISQSFQFVAAMPERLIGDPIARLTPQFGTQHNRLFQQYMLGEIDAAALKQQYGPLLQSGLQGACANNKWEWCK